MARTYYTLSKFDTDAGRWFDEFGSYSRAEVVAERDAMRDDGTPMRHLTVIGTDGTAAAMIARRDALPVRAGR